MRAWDRSARWGHVVSSLRRPGRLLHRGCRRPRPVSSQRRCAAGPTGSPRCWPARPTTSAMPTSRSAAARCPRSSMSSSGPRWPSSLIFVTIYAGANDILRPKVDLDRLAQVYDAALERLTESGARVVVFTAFDPGGSALYRPLRARFALYNELVRDSAHRLGADIVDFWRLREYRDLRYWDADRMHLSTAGHERMATDVLDTLGVPHDLPATASGRPAEGQPRPAAAGAPRLVPRRRGALGAAPTHRAVLGRRPRPEGSPAADPRRLGSPRPLGQADVAQLVERDLPKVDVASSSLVIRSSHLRTIPSRRHAGRAHERDALLNVDVASSNSSSAPVSVPVRTGRAHERDALLNVDVGELESRRPDSPRKGRPTRYVPRSPALDPWVGSRICSGCGAAMQQRASPPRRPHP